MAQINQFFLAQYFLEVKQTRRYHNSEEIYAAFEGLFNTEI